MRCIARHGSERVSKLALISAVTPLFIKTADHDGPDKSLFHGIRAGLLKDRPQFLEGFNPLFYGTDSGQQVSPGIFRQTVQIRLQGDAPDLRGYGETDKPAAGYDKRNMPRDIRELMSALDLPKVELVGHDRGARVATRFARD